jgi:hypothetical protein
VTFHEVPFEPVDGSINDLIDDAYRAKHHGSPYLGRMIGARARSATIRVMPRDTDGWLEPRAPASTLRVADDHGV